MLLPRLANTSGRSPLEKLATTLALVTGLPQSSATWTSIGLGQLTGEAKLVPKVRITAWSCCGAHPSADGPAPLTSARGSERPSGDPPRSGPRPPAPRKAARAESGPDA